MKYLQTKHERNSAKITTLIMLIITLLLFVVGQDYKEQPDEYGVAINFSSASDSEPRVTQNVPQDVDDVVEDEIIEDEIIEDEVVEVETPEENTTEDDIEDDKEEALENEEKLREEAEEAENLRKELEAKKKAEAEIKEKEAQKAKEQAEKEAKVKEAAEKAKALAEAQAKVESEAKAAEAAAKKAREGNQETSFALIENAPIYPGCDGGDNEAKKKCMSAKIKKFITDNFNTDLASDLTGIQKINISFKINTSGRVVSIRAVATNPKLEEEAKRVTSLLPKMKPGMQQGTPVVVSYGLPIRITLE